MQSVPEAIPTIRNKGGAFSIVPLSQWTRHCRQGGGRAKDREWAPGSTPVLPTDPYPAGFQTFLDLRIAAEATRLLRYIETYGYSNVQALFLRNVQDICTTGNLYQKLMKISGVSEALEAACFLDTSGEEAGEFRST